MSHVTATKTNIKDLDALEKACHELGLELVRGQTTYAWFGRWVNDYHGADAAYKQGIDPSQYGRCLHAIRVKDNKHAYEIGVVNNPDGEGYSLIWDFYGGRGRALQNVVGKDAGKLRLAYNQQVAKAEMAKLKSKGFKLVKSVDLNKGQVQLVYRKN